MCQKYLPEIIANIEVAAQLKLKSRAVFLFELLPLENIN